MDEKLRILLCEDDENLGMLLREYLQAKGYAAELYPDGEAGYKAFLKNKYDLCVFDVMMPKKDGFTLAQEVRAANAEIPIIFLTAKTLKEDILEGFKIGADDYITKPFSTQELLARIRAVLRRRAPEQVNDSVTIGELVLDAATYRVTYQGQPLKVGPTEFKLLHFLMKHSERVHSRSQLLDKVWGDHVFIEERTVDVHVKRLREALGAAGAMVETVRGAGYRLTAQPQALLRA